MSAFFAYFSIRRVLAVTAFLAAAFAPSYAAGPGKIVYSTDGAIALMNADGSNRVSLTTGFVASDPALSADGQWIAFQGADTSGSFPYPEGLWIMKAEPAGPANVPVRVLEETAYGYRMSWHPGGRWLAFKSDTDFQIYVLAVLDESGHITPESATNSKIKLTTSPFSYAQDPAFSPDGKFIAYSASALLKLLRVSDDNGDWTPEGAGNQPMILTSLGVSAPQNEYPSWSPDGRKIICEHVDYDDSFQNPESALAVITIRDAQGNLMPESAANPRQLFTPLVPGVRMFQYPTWSPDGSLIAFVPTPAEGESVGVYKINASGPEHPTLNPSVRLTPDDEFSFGPMFSQPGGVLLSDEPAPVPPNIIAWYPGDYAAADVVGAQHASLNNDIMYGRGKVGLGLRFDGDADYAVVQDSEALNFTGNITVEAWINPETVGGGTRAIVAKKNNNDATSSFYLNVQDDGRLSFSAQRADNTFFNALSTSSIPANVFSHVAATVRGDTVTLYRNGAIVGTLTTNVLRPATPGGQMIIGAKRTQLTPQNQLTSYFHGVIDELAIYNRALSSTEIAAIYNAGSNGKLRADAARDFSKQTNNQGQLWSYGSFATGFLADSASFALLTDPFSSGALSGWDVEGESHPFVVANLADAVTDIYGPRQLALVPPAFVSGVGGKFAVVRWTASEAGSYAIGADFSHVRSAGGDAYPTDYYVMRGPAQLASGGVFPGSLGSASPAHPFAAVLELSAGETVDFAVRGAGGGPGETSLFASAVRLPAAKPIMHDPRDLDIDFTGVAMAGKKWTFEVRQDDFEEHSGRLKLRVQYSPTPGVEASWTDVPDGTMARVGSVGRHKVELTTQIPVGSYAFRVITSVAGVGDRVTAPSEIFHIAAPAPMLELVAEVTSASDEDGSNWRDIESIEAGNPAVIHTDGSHNFITGTLISISGVVGSAPEINGTHTVTVVDHDTFSLDGVNVFTPGTGGEVKRLPTTHRGDLLTYTFKYRNVGAVAATGLRVEAQLPAGIKVKSKSRGALSRTERPFGTTYSFLYWKIPSLAPSDEFQTQSYTAQVLEPSAKTEATLNVIGSTIHAFASLLNDDRTVFWANTHLMTKIENPFSVEVIADTLTPDVGGYVRFDIIVRNRASYAARKVQINAQTATGLFLPLEGDALQFFDSADPDGQPSGPPIDSATRKQARFKKGPNPQRNDHGPDESMVGAFYVGSMLPGAAVKVRARMQVMYDYAVHFIRVEDIGATSTTPAGRVVSSTAPLIDLFPHKVPNAPKPVINFAMSQRGASDIINPADNKRIVTATAAGLAVPDVAPKRLSNEITYTAVILNTGPIDADFMSILLTIPEHTKYKAGSLRINGAKPPVAPAFGELGSATVLGTTLPAINGDAPFAQGSVIKVEYTVKVNPRTAVGTRILQPGGFLASRAVAFPFFGFYPALTQLEAEVVAPATMTYETLNQPADVRPTTPVVRHSIIYRNGGGLAAAGVGVRYTIPAGLKLQSASYIDTEKLPVAITRARSINAPAANATSGTVTFNIGKVDKGSGGIVQVVLVPDPEAITRVANGQQTPDGAYRIAAPVEAYDASTASSSAARERNRGAAPAGTLQSLIVAPYFDPTLAKTFAMVVAPASAAPDGEITYKVVWGNLSNVTAGVGAIVVPIPEGVDYVAGSATPGRSTANESDDAPIYRAREALNAEEIQQTPNGRMVWVTNAAPNSATVGTFKVRIHADVSGKITMRNVRLGLDQSGVRYVGEVSTHILDPNQPIEAQQAQIYATAVGSSTDETLGSPDLNTQFSASVRSISTESISVGLAGADFARIETNGAIAIPLGAGKLVAAGGGNLITDNGAGLVAAGGGNLVAAGAGNAISIPTVSGLLSGSQIVSSAPSLVAAGGLNLVAAGGGNLIGADGASLIGSDGATLGQFSLGAGGAQFLPAGGGAAIVLGQQGANLVAAGGGNLVAAGAGNLVAAGAGNLVAAGGGNLVAAGGLNLIQRNGSYLVAAGGLNLVAAGAGNLVAAGGLNLAPQAGSNLVAAGAGNFVTSSNGLVAAGGGN